LLTEFDEMPNINELHYKIYQGSFMFDSIGCQIGEITLSKIKH
jgi:hypothetical protein